MNKSKIYLIALKGHNSDEVSFCVEGITQKQSKSMLNIQIYSNVPLIMSHIFTYLNILVYTKRTCMYIYLSGEDSVPCFPLKPLADLELSRPLATLPEPAAFFMHVDFGAIARERR